VNRSDVGGVESGERGVEPARAHGGEVGLRQGGQQALADPQPQIARCLARESDGRQALDGDGRLAAGGRHHVDEALDNQAGLASPGAGIDEHVPPSLRDGDGACGQIGAGRPATAGHQSACPS
jgi:hypothetical protein